MRLLINGQDINGGSSGVPSLDEYSDQWKTNVEDWLNYLFGVPKSAFDTNKTNDLNQAIADHVTQFIGDVLHKVGIALLHMAPGLMLVVCMGSILGAMIGSARCRHYASVSALATLILEVVNKCVA